MNIYDIWFSRIDISNDIKLKLLEKFDIDTIWKLTKNELLELGLLESSVNQILDIKYKMNLEKYEKYFSKNGIDLITFKQQDYPIKLSNISSRPAYINVRGDRHILDDRVSIMNHLQQFLKQEGRWAIVPVTVAVGLSQEMPLKRLKTAFALPRREISCVVEAQSKGPALDIFFDCLRQVLATYPEIEVLL